MQEPAPEEVYMRSVQAIIGSDSPIADPAIMASLYQSWATYATAPPRAHGGYSEWINQPAFRCDMHKEAAADPKHDCELCHLRRCEAHLQVDRYRKRVATLWVVGLLRQERLRMELGAYRTALANKDSEGADKAERYIRQIFDRLDGVETFHDDHEDGSTVTMSEGGILSDPEDEVEEPDAAADTEPPAPEPLMNRFNTPAEPAEWDPERRAAVEDEAAYLAAYCKVREILATDAEVFEGLRAMNPYKVNLLAYTGLLAAELKHKKDATGDVVLPEDPVEAAKQLRGAGDLLLDLRARALDWETRYELIHAVHPLKERKENEAQP